MTAPSPFARPGTENGNAKVTVDTVSHIRWVYRQRVALPSNRDLARIHGLSLVQVARIGRGEQWEGVP